MTPSRDGWGFFVNIMSELILGIVKSTQVLMKIISIDAFKKLCLNKGELS